MHPNNFLPQSDYDAGHREIFEQKTKTNKNEIKLLKCAKVNDLFTCETNAFKI